MPLLPWGQPAQPASPLVVHQVACEPVVTDCPEGVTITFGTVDQVVQIVGPATIVATLLADVVDCLAVHVGAA